MRVLITGAAGQVGQDLIHLLRAEGHDVHGSDLTNEAVTTELATVPWHHLDVTDTESIGRVFLAVKPQRVFHLAAILSARGEEVPQRTYAVNQTGLYNVLETALAHDVEQVIFTSTIAVFGPGVPDPVGEDVSLNPTTMYGVTKVAGELLGDYYHRRFGLDFRGVRFPGLISASLPGGGTSDYALFMFYEGVRSGRYQAFCRPETRIPLMYMPDGVRALAELSGAPRSRLTRSVYNIAAFSPTAAEIADCIRASLPDVDLTFKPDPGRQAILDSWPQALDDTCARTDWGWKPAYNLAQMRDDLIPRIRQLLQDGQLTAAAH